MELSNSNWKPRKLTAPDGPRTIQQVQENAARDGCIYLPQQDSPPEKQQPAASNKLEEVIFSKIRPKGMEDILGTPGDFGGLKMGTGPGVIPGVDNEFGYGGSSSTEVAVVDLHLKRSSGRTTVAATAMTEETTRSGIVSSPSMRRGKTLETGSRPTGTRHGEEDIASL